MFIVQFVSAVNFTWDVSARRIWSWFARRKWSAAMDAGTRIVSNRVCCCIRYTISQGNVTFLCKYLPFSVYFPIATTYFMNDLLKSELKSEMIMIIYSS